MCNINILHLIEGAKQARGLTVIIDVFRAFSLECYLYDMDVEQIRPVGTVEEAFALKRRIQNSILIGERHGEKCDGFDYGNSPSTILKKDVAGKTIIHTTSAGTQGIVNATHAGEIITGSLVNAKAVAEYILARQPQTVSLVCMGNGGVRLAPEDELCAKYIKSILEGREFLDLEQKVSSLKNNGGKHFFDKSKQSIFPEADFHMCIEYNKFPFVITIEKDEIGFVASRKNVRGKTAVN
ncbi:MAG: 2-phosphosulfolactate phosphatase [Roseburia sp.]|nr:2-phosphosulfolactate phosphatase [Roseburia sp.]